jgi:dTDP-4-amino-4,6-dideoxygalactose transaminase
LLNYIKRNKGVLLNDDIVIGDDNFERGISKISMNILKNIESWDAIYQKRRENYQYLLIGLDSNPTFKPLYKTLTDGFCPMTLPLLAEGAKHLIMRLNEKGVPAYSWPGVSNLHPYAQENIDKFPITKFLVNNLIMLPVHQDLTKRQLDYMVQELSRD